jgi:hypothetical protein
MPKRLMKKSWNLPEECEGDTVPALAFRASGKRLFLRNRPLRAFIRSRLLGEQKTPSRRREGVVDEKCCMFFALI